MFKISSRAGKVLLVERDRVKVDLFSKNLPSECASRGCGACKTNSPQIEKYYPKSFFYDGVLVGDLIKVETRLIEDGFAAAILFLTPIFFATIAYYLATLYGMSGESLAAIVSSILGGIFGFAVVVVFDKIFSKLNPPQIFKE
ncbi:MAG: SoxR reducing system RseC family protein [Chitinivibrionia bacterium]|nr:SoxR reducing system RseC family protein [Chitinivibrionia bacterium]